MPKEKDFQLKVEKFLTDKGIYWVKYWGGGNFTRSGIPDLLCCINGRFVGVELKTDDGKVSELQQYNLDKIKKSGGVALVLRPSDFEKFKSMVDKLQYDYIFLRYALNDTFFNKKSPYCKGD